VRRDLLSSAEPKPEVGVSGVQAYRLDNGKQAGNYWLDERPVLRAFNDLALARNGDVYVTDSAQAAVYRVHAGRLDLLVRDERLTIANGIALAPDQQRLYVARVEGLSLVDVRTRKVQRLSVPRTEASTGGQRRFGARQGAPATDREDAAQVAGVAIGRRRRPADACSLLAI